MKKLLLLFMLCLFASSVWGMDVRLACDPNGESDLAGYRIYWSQTSGQYSTTQKEEFSLESLTPTAPEFLIEGLDETQTWYFVATAYDTEGLESGYSNEVSVSWDGVTGIPPGAPGGLQPVSIVVVRPDGTTVTITIP